MPELVGCGGLVPELISSLDHHEGRAGDQVMSLEKPVNAGLGHDVALCVGEPDGQFWTCHGFVPCP